MMAEGHVAYREKTGDVYFADKIDFTKKAEDGFAREIKGVMQDNARLAARTGQKIADKRVIFQKGIYSPCNVCRLNPEQDPLWQIKADKIIYDKENDTINYHHARMEFYGVPFFYTPYFWHAGPRVKRKSGLLKPEYGTSTDLGKFISLPIFIDIAPNIDATIMPIFTSSEGAILRGEYRHRFNCADLQASGSYTSSHSLNGVRKDRPASADYPSHDRWHAFVKARVELSDEHLLTIDVNRASDTTYLRRYPVLPQGKILEPRQSILTSFIALEQFKQTSYGVIKSYAFQSDNSKTAPYIIPYGDFTFESMPGKCGETYTFDANVLSLHRVDPVVDFQNHIFGAPDMDRLSVAGGFRVPYISPAGDMWAFKAQLRWDYYNLDGYRFSRTHHLDDTISMKRLFPQASLLWRYPWVSYCGDMSWVVEPAAMLITSEHGGNSRRLAGSLIPFPNEDSQITTLDQTLLFMMNRFYGWDRIDSGSRLVYGGHSKMYFSEGRRLFLFLGQTIRLDRLRVLPNFSGENKYSSNVIAGFRLVPCVGVDVSNRMMLDRNRLAIRISESSISLTMPFVTLNAGHTYMNKSMLSSHRPISQINWTVSTPSYKNFSFTYGESRNLKVHRDAITGLRESNFFSRGIGGVYENECLKASLTVTRTAYRYRDIKPATTVLLVLDFKNIGSISPLSFIGNPFNSGGPLMTR
jgi:LPS-assembly protein